MAFPNVLLELTPVSGPNGLQTTGTVVEVVVATKVVVELVDVDVDDVDEEVVVDVVVDVVVLVEVVLVVEEVVELVLVVEVTGPCGMTAIRALMASTPRELSPEGETEKPRASA